MGERRGRNGHVQKVSRKGPAIDRLRPNKPSAQALSRTCNNIISPADCGKKPAPHLTMPLIRYFPAAGTRLPAAVFRTANRALGDAERIYS
jgi:hypothetical protein